MNTIKSAHSSHVTNDYPNIIPHPMHRAKHVHTTQTLSIQNNLKNEFMLEIHK